MEINVHNDICNIHSKSTHQQERTMTRNVTVSVCLWHGSS